MRRTQILQAYFRETGETLEQLQEKSGVHYVTISRIKNGAGCRMSTWEKLEVGMGITSVPPPPSGPGEERCGK